jgi:GNAT superfamily N-acetyltransferase
MRSIEGSEHYDSRSGKSSPVNVPILRQASVADVPAVVALVERAYRGDASRAGWTTEADLLDGQRTDPEDVRAAIEGPGHVVLLALDAERLVASVLLSPDGDAILLGMFAVEPTLQGAGLGRHVLGEAERWMRDSMGATRGRMTVLLQRAELLAWYARRGWLPTGARKPFHYGNARFGMPRRDDLEFVVLEKSFEAP